MCVGMGAQAGAGGGEVGGRGYAIKTFFAFTSEQYIFVNPKHGCRLCIFEQPRNHIKESLQTVLQPANLVVATNSHTPFGLTTVPTTRPPTHPSRGFLVCLLDELFLPIAVEQKIKHSKHKTHTEN